MRRWCVLGLIVMGGLGLASVAAQQPPVRGGADGRAAGGGRAPVAGLGGVEAISKVAANLYVIPGAGGTTAVFVAANGVVLVDTKLANNGQAILDQVKSVTNKPITHIINTHTHRDHVGSNQFFAPSVEIIVQENTAADMQKMPLFQDPANKQGLPDATFKDRRTVLAGADALDLYYFGAGHTNGDALVVFRRARVMHAGDLFAGNVLPLVDPTVGGSGVAYGETIGKAARGIKGVDAVITGHSTVMKWQDFVDYGEFNRLYVAHARASLKAGKTAEQAGKDLVLPAKFKSIPVATGRGGPAGNFPMLYEELKSAK